MSNPSWQKKTKEGKSYIVWNEAYQAYRNDCIARGENPESQVKFTRFLSNFIVDFRDRYIVMKVDGKATRVLMGETFQSTEKC